MTHGSVLPLARVEFDSLNVGALKMPQQISHGGRWRKTGVIGKVQRQQLAFESRIACQMLGAVLLSDDTKNKKAAYRDPKTMSALADFWRTYFEKSNAQLIEFGQPALLNQAK